MCGAMLPSTGIQSNLGDQRYWPIYEEANRLGCAIGVHGGAHENLGLDDLSPYAPVHALGHPFGQMISFGGMVFNGVFDKFPNVKFGFMEGGVAWMLVCLERFDRSWETHIQHDPRKRFLDFGPRRKSANISRAISTPAGSSSAAKAKSPISPMRSKESATNPGSFPATIRTKSTTSSASTKSMSFSRTKRSPPPTKRRFCTATRAGFTTSAHRGCKISSESW